MNTTNKPIANIVMFNLTTPKEMRFGFLFKSDLEVFKRIVIQDIKFRITKDDRNLKEHIDCPIYNLYVNNDAKTNRSLLNGGLSSSAPSRNLYSDEFTKYLKDNGITNDYIVSIMTLKSYLQYFKKMPKSGTEFTL